MDIKTIIFDIDGVLIEADKEVRIQKYKDLFRQGMELVKSKNYAGSSWLFAEMKRRYDNGEYKVNPKYYKLINKDTHKILSELEKRYDLFACSLASKSVTMEKLKITGLMRYFKDILLKPLGVGRKEIAVVDDRFNSGFGNGFYIIKFNHGQHKKEEGVCDMQIDNIKELLN